MLSLSLSLSLSLLDLLYLNVLSDIAHSKGNGGILWTWLRWWKQKKPWRSKTLPCFYKKNSIKKTKDTSFMFFHYFNLQKHRTPSAYRTPKQINTLSKEIPQMICKDLNKNLTNKNPSLSSILTIPHKKLADPAMKCGSTWKRKCGFWRLNDLEKEREICCYYFPTRFPAICQRNLSENMCVCERERERQCCNGKWKERREPVIKEERWVLRFLTALIYCYVNVETVSIRIFFYFIIHFVFVCQNKLWLSFLKKRTKHFVWISNYISFQKTKTKQNYFNFLDYFNIFITIISIYL